MLFSWGITYLGEKSQIDITSGAWECQTKGRQIENRLNIEHRTPNVERSIQNSMLDARCPAFSFLCLILCGSAVRFSSYRVASTIVSSSGASQMLTGSPNRGFHCGRYILFNTTLNINVKMSWTDTFAWGLANSLTM